MAASNVEKVLTVFRGIANRDPELTTQYVHTEHSSRVADGIAGLRDYVGGLAREDRLKVVRTFEDAPYVFTQADGQIADQNTFFDVFRFEDGLIVEHRGFPQLMPAQEKSKNRNGTL